MQFCRIYSILLRQFYLLRGSVARLLPLFVWVAVDVVLWGFTTRYLNSISAAGFNLVPVFLGAVLLWGFLVRVMQGVTMAFFEDVWGRNFLNLFATPLRISEYLAGLVATSILTSMVGLAMMLLLAIGVFGLSFFAYGLAIVSFMLVLFLSGIALGIVGVALVLRFGPAAEWLIWPIPAVISPFVGVFYPLAVLPEWMRAVSHILPPSYVFEAMRAVAAGEAASVGMLAVSGALAVGYVLLACWYFTRVYARALRTGLIARYSAESVN